MVWNCCRQCRPPTDSNWLMLLWSPLRQELIRRWDSERELFTTIPHTYFKIPKKNLLRLTNQTIARQVLRITSWIYESGTKFPPCCYRIFILWAFFCAVPLQTFTTRHNNRKLSIVMALSTNFTQCAPETTKFGKITQKGHFAVQGHSWWPISVPIESS